MFVDDINKFINKTNKKVNQVVKNTSIELGTRLVNKTPVDSGRAKANWQIDSKLNQIVIDSTDPSGSETVNNIKQADITGSVYIFNNVPYILRLEHGSSKQAPSGMRNVTIAEFQQIVNNEARRAN